MPFVNVNVESYLRCGSRLKNEVNLHVSLCLSSVFNFTPFFWNSRRIGRALLVLGSRLKNEVNSDARFLWFSSMFTFTHCFWNSVYWQGTVSSRLTLRFVTHRWLFFLIQASSLFNAASGFRTPCHLNAQFFGPIEFFNAFALIDLKQSPDQKLLIDIFTRNYLDDENFLSCA